MIYFAALVCLYFGHLVLKMHWITVVVVGIFFLIMLPIHKRRWKEYKSQINRFYEAASYMEHILYAFLREKKIDMALKNVLEASGEGRMKSTVARAFNHLEMAYDDTELMRNALKIIEDEFPARRISNIHQLMLHEESYGGDIEYPVKLLLEEKSAWENRTIETIEERKKQFGEVVCSILVSLGICGVILHFPIMEVDISQNLFTQILTVVVLILDDFIFLRGQKYLAEDYLTLDALKEEDYYRKKMKQYQEYEEKKERRVSYLLGGAFSFLVLFLFCTGNNWGGAIGLFFLLILLNQHKIGRHLAERSLRKNISCAFPGWLMDLILLMQMENVQMALEKSEKHVPAVLQQELDTLLEHLKMTPESPLPYENFLKEFQIPQVQSAMSMLYSLSMGNCGDAKEQISQLIQRNQKMLDSGEKIRLKDLNSGMYLLFLAPVLTASLKLVCDMAVFMVTFMQQAVI